AIPQLVIVDSSKSPITLLGSKTLGTNMSLRNIIVRDTLAFLLTGSATQGGQLQIVNISNPTSIPSPVTVALQANGAGGVALDCEGNYIYAASVDSASKSSISIITAP